MKSFLFFITFVLACLVSGNQLWAQEKKQGLSVSGTVVDEKDQTMPGVNVYIKNQPGVGTVTDINGKFSLKVEQNNILVFTFVGYENMEVLITSENTDMRIKLRESKTQMDEVVVVGHGQQRKVSVVGAVTTIDVKDINIPSSSVTNTLAGRVPGIIAVQRSGEPGSDFSQFWIRGISTFGANASALILIDGIERGGIDQIDPEDIESFTVLKDASATAVYGVRGANGVVLITTKKGSEGKLSIRFKGYGTLSYSPRMPEYLGAYDYARLANEAKAVRQDPTQPFEPLYDDVALDIIKNGLDSDLYPNVDWQKEILKPVTWNQGYYLSVSGGGAVARYFMSAGLFDSDALYKESGMSDYNTNVKYKKYTFRSNLDINVTKSTTVNFGVDGYITNQNRPGFASSTSAIWQAQANLTPLTVPVRYSNGALPAYGQGDLASPAVLLNETGYQTDFRNSIQSNLGLKQDFGQWVQGLSARALFSFDAYIQDITDRSKMPDLYKATGRLPNGQLVLEQRVEKKALTFTKSNWTSRKIYFEAAVNYDRVFADEHRVGALLHYYQDDETDSSDDKMFGSIPYRHQGLSGRLTYSYKDTYLLEGNFGYTGSENFRRGEQYGFFPSVALGWMPSSYAWMQEKMPVISYLKFRFSFGTAGNDQIARRRFPYFTFVSENAAASWGNSGSNGITETDLGADNLRWEKAVKTNYGLDLNLFQDKLNLVVDIFQDKRDGIFQRRTNLPDIVGATSDPYGNVGRMNSKGTDMSLAYSHLFSSDLSVTARTNFTYARNMIEYWEEPVNRYAYKNYTGTVYGAKRGMVALGLFESEEQIKSSPKQWGELRPGDIRYKDVNGDGKIDYDDYVPLSNSDVPQITYGLAFEFRYKNWDFNAFFRGTGKVDFFMVGNGYVPFNGGELGNVLTIANEQENRWTPASYSGDVSTENPNARFPRLTYGTSSNNDRYSTFWLKSGRYFRLQNVEVGYMWKSSFMKSIGMQNVRFYLVGENLFVWDQVKLWDPEHASETGAAYPIQRKFTFGLNVSF